MFNENLIRELAHQKSIDVDKVVAALEDALGTAARKFYKTREPVHAILKRDETGGVDIFVEKHVVETEEEIEDPLLQITPEEAARYQSDAKPGDVIRIDYIEKAVVDVVADTHTEIRQYEARKIDPKSETGDTIRIPLDKGLAELGRIAAQSAKQVLYQKVREAERDKVYKEFRDRVGQIEHGYVKRFERGDMIVDLNGRTEGVIPRSQQSRAERYSQGDRIRAVVVDVHTQPKGPQVVLSRTDPLLLVKLFEMEVPEIYDGTVMIKRAVREPGERAKIAVASKERDVDPVGACVGMKGSRVQSIIRELRGEKIDIIPWHEDIVSFAQNALAPARITRVSVTSEEDAIRPNLDVIVDDDQLSLAIGKRGLNVRLAAELIGARIDIKSEDEVKGEVADALTQMLQVAMSEARSEVSILDVDGIDPEIARLLDAAGYDDLDSVLNATAEDLANIDGIDVDAASRLIESAQEFDRVAVGGQDVPPLEELQNVLMSVDPYDDEEYDEEWSEEEADAADAEAADAEEAEASGDSTDGEASEVASPGELVSEENVESSLPGEPAIEEETDRAG
ncbi:MAG: transcription termination factor NusA [Acidobacteria bacterium]|nr:transcription termination factor NusA [Acidobacteriota bacterium]